jgi:hypothetical protein
MSYDQEKTQATEDYRLKRDRPRDECGDAARNLTQGCTGRSTSDAEILAELFKYHPPTEMTLPKYAAINQAAKNFAEVVLQNCPSSADRSAAIRLIRDARMTANASVALNGLSL